MLDKLKKAAGEWGSHFTFVDYAWRIGGLVCTAALSVAAAMTPWLQAAGPFGWFLIALASTALLAFASVPIADRLGRAWASLRGRDAGHAVRGLPRRGFENEPGTGAPERPARTGSAAGAVPREGTSSSAAPTVASPVARDVEIPEERQAKHELAVFAVESILPACDGQRTLQHAVIDRLCQGRPVVGQLTKDGLDASGPVPVFLALRKQLWAATISSPDQYSLNYLEEVVKEMSNLYAGYCSLASWLCRDTDVDHRTDDATAGIYLQCQEMNRKIEDEYQHFCRDPRFGRLYNVNPRPILGEAFTSEP